MRDYKLLRAEALKKAGKDSPGLAYIRLMRQYVTAATGKSNLRVQQGGHVAQESAVRYGLPFDDGDFQSLGLGFGELENLYSIAVDVRHRSACRALELALHRKPFLGEKGWRIAVGNEVLWLGDHQSRVNSFLYDGTVCTGFVLLQYHRGGASTRVKHRYEVTREQWKARVSPPFGGGLLVGSRLTWQGNVLEVFDFAEDMKSLRLFKAHENIVSVQDPRLITLTVAEIDADIEAHQSVEHVQKMLDEHHMRELEAGRG